MRNLKVKANPPFYISSKMVWGNYQLWGSKGKNFVGQINGKNNAEMVLDALNKYYENEDN